VIGECSICLCDGVDIYKNICGHLFCSYCWFDHIKNRIISGSPFVSCMEDSCEAPLLMDHIIFLLGLNKNEGVCWISKFEKKLCESFITNNREYQFCTGANCFYCIKVNKPGIELVSCCCGKTFCFKCQSDDHSPCRCEEKNDWISKILKE
jgi:ariadne-1